MMLSRPSHSLSQLIWFSHGLHTYKALCALFSREIVVLALPQLSKGLKGVDLPKV